MINMRTMKVLFSLALLSCSTSYVTAGCKTPKAVEIDKAWYKEQGEKGWVSCLTKDLSQDDLVKSSNAGGKPESYGSNSVCFTNSYAMAYYKCDYKNVNDQMCVLQSSANVLPVPKYFRSTIVSTDGSSYIAAMGCLSGDVDAWIVFCKDDQPLSDDKKKTVLKALQAEGDKVSGKPMGVDGKNKFMKECPKDGVPVGGVPVDVPAKPPGKQGRKQHLQHDILDLHTHILKDIKLNLGI